jgi:YVTN family beta-propeller protein
MQCPMCLCVWTVDTAHGHAPSVVRGNRRNDAGGDRKEGVTGDAAFTHSVDSNDGEQDDAVIAKVGLGDCLRDIVTSPNGDLVYVMTAGSVKAINSLHRVVASIPIGPEPKQMLMSSDGSRIYVTGYDGSLSIIDRIAMTAKTIGVPRNAAAAVSPDGNFIYLAHGEVVGDGRSNWISAIRADGESVALIAVDQYPTGIALSPDGRRLYVASAGRSSDHRGTIAVIDTASHKTVDFIAVNQAPETLVVDPEGFLHVTHYHTNSISMVDPERRCAIVIALEDAPIDVVIRPESDFIYTANLHSLTLINTCTTANESIWIGELPRRLKVSTDGRRLYATDFAHGTIWVLDTSDHSVVGTVAVGAHPAAVALSPNGELLYVTDARDGTLTVISTTLVKPTTRDK